MKPDHAMLTDAAPCRRADVPGIRGRCRGTNSRPCGHIVWPCGVLAGTGSIVGSIAVPRRGGGEGLSGQPRGLPGYALTTPAAHPPPGPPFSPLPPALGHML